jgi:hypothetical protein
MLEASNQAEREWGGVHLIGMILDGTVRLSFDRVWLPPVQDHIQPLFHFF